MRVTTGDELTNTSTSKLHANTPRWALPKEGGHIQQTHILEIKGNCEVIGRQTFPLFLTHRLGVLLQFMEL